MTTGQFCNIANAWATTAMGDLKLAPDGKIYIGNNTTPSCSTDTLYAQHYTLHAINNPDQPGRFVRWLYPRTPVHAWSVPGTWFDVGSKENLEEANRVFTQFAR